MNKIILKSMSIRNFKGIAKLDVSEFNEVLTTFYGENGSGKSTIKNAWEWVLCQNVDDYIPNLNNQEIPDLITSVVVEIELNGLKYTLKRESKPKYTTDRETQARVKSGNENTYIIDDIELKEKNYKEQIAGIIGDGVFENLPMLTDKEFFNSDSSKWKWTDRRKCLLAITGAESEANSIIQKDKYDSIRDFVIKGYATSDIKSMIAKEKKGYKTNQETNLVLINAKQKELDEYLSIDFEKVSQELAISKTKYTKLINASKKENAVDELKKIEDEILKSTQEISTLKTRDMLKREDMETFKLKIFEEALDTKGKYESSASWVKFYKEKLDALNKEDIKDTCLTCGQKLPADKIKEVEDNIKKQVVELEKQVEESKARAKELYEKYNNLQKQYSEQEEKIRTFVQNERIAELETRVLELNSIVKSKKQSNLSNLSNQEQKSLETKISDLEREMAKKEYLEKGYRQIKLWQSEMQDLADKIVAVENKEIALRDFVKEQTDVICNTVNNYFSNGVSWSLYTMNYNGSLEESCICLYNNKRYSSLSTGEKNTANMEVIKTLQESYNVNIPIFSDNAEANTIPYETDRQVIEFYAKKGTHIEGCTKITDIY